ncbi:MAG: PAS domain S-box protein [Leptospiraceae bacterium]|nr:PAS domain S-box protein [Leptospiraceae bacterium]
MNILLVEDSEFDCFYVTELLKDTQIEYNLHHESDLASALEHIRTSGFPDIILLDLNLPDSSGLNTFQALKLRSPKSTFIILTGNRDNDLALNSISLGAQDYLLKGKINSYVLERSIKYSLERTRQNQEVIERSQALQAANLRMQKLMENLPAGICLEDKDGYITYMNPHFIPVLGFKPYEIPQKFLEVVEFLAGNYAESFDLKEKYQWMAENRYHFKGEEFTNKEGKILSLEYIPLFSHDNEYEGNLWVFNDITSSKQWEKKKELVKILDSTSEEFYIISLETFRYLYTNSTALSNLALEQEEIFLKHPYEIKEGMSKEEFFKLIDPLLKDEVERLEFECLHKRKDGMLYPVQLLYTKMEWNGMPVILSVGRNVAEKKYTENLIKEKQELLSSVFDLVQVGICILDREGNIKEYNQKFKTIFSENEDVNFKSFHQFAGLSGTRKKRFYHLLFTKDTMSNKKPLKVKTLKGNNIWIDIKATSITYSDGRKYRLLAIIDVSQQKISERNIKNLLNVEQSSRKMLSTIINASPDWIYIKDLEFRYLRVNDSFARDMHLNPDDILGRSDIQIGFHENIVFGDDEREIKGFREEDLEVLKGKTIHNSSVEVIDKNGKVRIFDTYKYPLFSDEQVIGIVGISRDITERRKEEERVKDLLKKEIALNEFKSRFIRMVSHEFRTPLTTIMNSSHLIKSYGNRLDDEKKEKYFKYIEDAIHNLIGLLDDVILINQSEEDSLNNHPVEMKPVNTIQDIIEKLEISYKTHQILFSVEGDRKTVYSLDDSLFRIIVQNLITNAIKYSPGKKSIEVYLELDKDDILIQVKDYGIGIPQKEYDSLFKSFFRASNVKNISGIGLGLNIVKSCVEKMKGKIWFESKENEGTIFYINIPAYSILL